MLNKFLLIVLISAMQITHASDYSEFKVFGDKHEYYMRGNVSCTKFADGLVRCELSHRIS